MTTIKEQIQNKVKSAQKWEEANPGRSWALEYDEKTHKIYIETEMLNSPAYSSLNKVAMLIFSGLLSNRDMKCIKRHGKKKWAVENNGSIVLPYTEAHARWGIGPGSFVRAIDELQVKGFIDITHQGHGGRKPANGTGDFNTYAIDVRWKDFDAEKGVSRIPPKNPRKKDERHQGFKVKATLEKAKKKKDNYQDDRPILLMAYQVDRPIWEVVDTEKQ